MQGQLFSSDFLLRGIAETEAWQALAESEIDTFIADLQSHFSGFNTDSTLNEAQTEDELVAPVIDRLGWRTAGFPKSTSRKADERMFRISCSSPIRKQRNAPLP
jgi:hypothetical protein